MTGGELTASVQAEIEALQTHLLAKVEANLSGDVLQTRSGALKASIVASIAANGDVVTAAIASVGVPYAAIQEEGGVTAPHDIVPVKAQALAFAGAGGPVFARRVHHPGSAIPAHHFMGDALDMLRVDISSGLKGAVTQALGAS